MAKDRKYIEVDGTRWAYLETGSKAKPPLLMLHGLNSYADYFNFVCSYLKNDFRLIIPDVPGFGFTETLKDNSYKSIAKQLIRFCKTLGIQSTAVLGISAGGSIALSMALEDTRLVKTVIVQSPLWRAQGVRYSFLERIQIGLCAAPDRVLQFIAKPLLFTWTLKLLGVIKPRLKVIIDHYADLVVESFGLVNIAGLKMFWKSLQSIDLSEKLNMIRSPVLCIVGKEDELIPPVETFILAHLLRKGAVAEISDAGHELLFQKPEQVSGIIKAYLSYQ